MKTIADLVSSVAQNNISITMINVPSLGKVKIYVSSGGSPGVNKEQWLAHDFIITSPHEIGGFVKQLIEDTIVAAVTQRITR